MFLRLNLVALVSPLQVLLIPQFPLAKALAHLHAAVAKYCLLNASNAYSPTSIYPSTSLCVLSLSSLIDAILRLQTLILSNTVWTPHHQHQPQTMRTIHGDARSNGSANIDSSGCECSRNDRHDPLVYPARSPNLARDDDASVEFVRHAVRSVRHPSKVQYCAADTAVGLILSEEGCLTIWS